MSDLEHPSSASQDEDGDDMDFSAPRKSWLSAPQLQAQLSRLTHRTRLRRLKNTLLSKGACQQVTKIEDLCHAQVSHKWLLPPGRMRGKCPDAERLHYERAEKTRQQTLGGWCRCCGSFLNPQVEHAETFTKVEATRGHYACVHAVVCGMKLADPGITTEPRGLTASQSRPADIFTTAAVPGRSAALDMCVWHPPLQQQPEETQRRRHWIANSGITETKSWNCDSRAFNIALLFGQRMDDSTRP